MFRQILLVVTVTLLLGANAAAQPVLINGVPDWNQPQTYAAFIQPLDPPPNAPATGPGVTGWCTPTSAANAMGYYEDMLGHAGLADGIAFPATIAYPNNDTDAGAADGLADYQQGQWNDGSLEIGYFMDTGGWRTGVGHDGTLFGGGIADCPGGITNYVSTYLGQQWTAWNYDVFNGAVAANSWTDYLQGGFAPTIPAIGLPVPANGILFDEPVLVTLDAWVDPLNPNKFTDQNNIEWYDWTSVSYTDGGHTVLGMGYALNWDPDGMGPLPQADWMIAHDNWGTTGVDVAVPWDSYLVNNLWWANTHIKVPEPTAMLILSLACLGLLRRRR